MIEKFEEPTYSLGDIIDKLSILSRKIYFNDEQSISEHRFLERGLAMYGINGKLITNAIRLTQMNIEIWNLEHEMRMSQKKDTEYTQEEYANIGKKAVKIREANKKRIEYKNLLNQLTKQGFQETKIKHASE